MPSQDRKLLVLETDYTLEGIRQREIEHSILCRDLGGYFAHVWSVHPFATLVTSPTWTAKFGAPVEHRLAPRHTFIEGKVGRFAALKHLFPLNFLLSQASLFLRLRKLIRRERISVIRAASPLYTGLLGLALARSTGIPLVVRVGGNHDKFFETTGRPLEPRLWRSRRIEKIVERFVFKRADLVAGANQDNLNFALANGARPERSTLFRYGNLVDARHFTDPAARGDPTKVLEELGVEAGKFLLYVGRLEPIKQPDHVLEVLAKLRNDGFGVKAILAGEGRMHDELAARARQLGVADALILPGNLSQSALAHLYPAAAAVISPHTGRVLSEAALGAAPIVAYQKYSTQKVRTFTIGFNEQAFNEADHARAVAQALGTEHHERIVTAREAQEVIPKLPQIYDEPFADSSQIPTHLVSAFAREQVKVALSGDAGDELFGGYTRYFTIARAWAALKTMPSPLRAAIARPLSRLSPSAWDRIGRRPYFGIKARKALRTIAHARSLDEVFGAFLDEWSEQGSPVLAAASDAAPFDLALDPAASDALRMMYCDAVSYLPDDILCKVDRASMAVSLEVHCPFLDHRVAELAARIPVDLKIRGGTGKHVLRQMLYREAPRELFERPKTGFGIPVGEWIKGPLRDWAESLLDPDRLRGEGWLDAGRIEQRWREHLSGERDSTGALWSVLMFESWLEAEGNSDRYGC